MPRYLEPDPILLAKEDRIQELEDDMGDVIAELEKAKHLLTNLQDRLARKLK